MPDFHKDCGGRIVIFSSFTEKYDVETPVCTKCGETGKSVRTPIV